MSKTRRQQTLLALLEGSKINDGTKAYIAIRSELHELGAATSVTPEKRRGLLQVLHSTRALDSGLQLSLRKIGAVINRYSIGAYLDQLGTAGRLPKSEVTHFKKKIADVRNRFMHQANQFPSSSKEADTLLAEIQTCLQRVLSVL